MIPVVSLSLFYDAVEFVYFVYDCDSSALVAIFSRLYYPDITLLDLCTVTVLLLSFCLFDNSPGTALVIVDKLQILWVFEAFTDVEGQGKVVVHVLSHQCIVLLQVVKKCLLVAQEKIVR